MGRVFKFSFLVASVLGGVEAQDTSSSAPLPPAVRSAIDRLTNHASGVEEHPLRLVGPASTPFVKPPNPGLARSSLTRPCSVPLIEMPLVNPDRFTMRTAVPPATEDRMPLARKLAPPCDSRDR